MILTRMCRLTRRILNLLETGPEKLPLRGRSTRYEVNSSVGDPKFFAGSGSVTLEVLDPGPDPKLDVNTNKNHQKME
jgi:hypothetical protein